MANTPAFRGWQHPWSLILLPVGGSSSDARQEDRRAAVVMTTATTTAACTRARAARAHYTLKLGPRIYGPRRCLYPCPGGLCFPDPTSAGGSFPPSRAGWFAFGGSGLWLRSGAGRAQLATSRVTGPVLAASSTSEMLCRSQWSRSGLSECIHVAVDGHHLMPVFEFIRSQNKEMRWGMPV